MLRRLSISNYTLIEHLEVNLQQGFTAITGETGSGKSIILGALGLLLGNRAESGLLHDPERKCVLEAWWDTSSVSMQDFLKKQELDLEKESVLRREITPSGKSRLFLNDTPVTASVMKAFREISIDIHSQHEHSALRSNAAQIDILDAFALQEEAAKNYKAEYKAYLQSQHDLRNLKDTQIQKEKERDYVGFQLKELQDAQLEELENRDLESELQTLENAEEIRSQLFLAAGLFEGNDYSPSAAIKQIKTILGQTASLSPGLNELAERMASLAIEWADLQSEIEQKAEATELDEEQLSILRGQHDTLNKLLFKHSKQGVDQLLELREALEVDVDNTDGLDREIAALEKQIAAQEKALFKAAKTLSEARQKAGNAVEKSIRETLGGLSMPHAEVRVDLERQDQLGPQGVDKVAFLFKTNKGSNFGPLDKVASGGELSRMMLALKGAIAERKALPILIFDEIDTGVSGEVAHQMGSLMRQMSASQQLIAITHLPQIAGKANHHWRVSKDDSELKTVSLMKVLTPEERVTEIATMLSGDKLTEAALEQARVLLEG